MTECSSCGTELTAHETHCPVCGKPTAHYHRQRRCLHCGTPVAEKAQTCMMCGNPVDSLPLSTSIFSGSWLGIGLGVLIIVGIVVWVNSYQVPPDNTVRAGQGLPSTATPSPTITRTPTATGTPLPTATVTPTPTPTPRTHIVERGESLFYIAGLYRVTVEDLVKLNNIDDVQLLSVGQTLLIPYITRSGAEDNQLPPQIVYVIESGDTLLAIAIEHGTSVDDIIAANPDINLDLIFPGQEIVVPLATPTPTSTPTATLTPTSTPGPPYPPPDLLKPIEGQVVTGSTLFFNWTSTGLLADNEFYVLQLTWADGSRSEYWTKTSSWRISKDQRHTSGPITWTVTIMHQTGTNPAGAPAGVSLTDLGQARTVEWP